MRHKNRFLWLALIGTVVVFFPIRNANAEREARLRDGDAIDVRLAGVPPDEMATVNGQYTIDGDGLLNLPLVGRISACGQTVSRLQSTIEATYRSRGIFAHPTITVIPSAPRYILVTGAVRAPQRIVYSNDMTFNGAVVAAGDFSEFANQKKIRFVRNNKSQVVNAKRIRSYPQLDFRVFPGDQIQVPDSWW